MIMFFCFSSYSAYGLALCGVGTFFNMLIHTIRSMLDHLLSFVDSTRCLYEQLSQVTISCFCYSKSVYAV